MLYLTYIGTLSSFREPEMDVIRQPHLAFSAYFGQILGVSALALLAVLVTIAILQIYARRKSITGKTLALSITLGIIFPFIYLFTIARPVTNAVADIISHDTNWDSSAPPYISITVLVTFPLAMMLILNIMYNLDSRYLLKKSNKPLNSIIKYSPVVMAACLALFIIIIFVAANDGGIYTET